jgi:DNA-binding MarR family transcriptional regulator
VRQGLIERERCATDARGFDAVLTAAGRAKLEEARVTHRADIRERFLAHMSEDEQRVLAGVWSRLLEESG